MVCRCMLGSFLPAPRSGATVKHEPADREFKAGDRVIKNPATWQPSEFDAWGAGAGVGVVVEVVADLGMVDVRWPAGRAHQKMSELIHA